MNDFVLLLLIAAIPCGFFASEVASGKGYSGTSWFIAGVLFGPLGLIAAAGLSDRRLRKYLRQIGEKQEAIKEELEPKTSKDLRADGYSIGTFELSEDAEDDVVWEKILSMLSSDIANKANRSNSYLNQPLFGGTEFVVNDSKGERLAFASRLEGSMNNYKWEVYLN